MPFSELQLFEERASLAEKELAKLRSELEALQKIVSSGDFEYNEDETVSKKLLEEAQKENEKLKMRVEILLRTREQRKAKHLALTTDLSNMKTMVSIYDTLYALFEKAIIEAYPDLTDPPVVISMSGNANFGDYQCNSALPICKLLSTINAQDKQKVIPKAIAENIMSKVGSSPVVAKLEVAPAGFINIFLKRDFGQAVLKSVLKNGKVPPPPVFRPKSVIVDFSSPNVAKEMHVGHLRSTIIGDSICRLLEYLGHKVLRLNHIGDWGTQFGMLIAHLEDKFPNYVTESPPISDLQSFYKESKVRFDNDEDFKKRAYANVVKLQSHDPKIIQGWKLICDVSRKEFQSIYNRLDIKLVERGESFYQKHMEALVKHLEEKNFLEEDEGRKIMWGLNKEGIPLTIVKSDGGFTYDTSDLAALKQRVIEEDVDWIIYVTDAGQATHFQTLQSCAKRARILVSAHRMDHVGFGVVLGEDKKKFKTRSGDTVKLSDLLDEGLKRAEEKLKEKERDKVLSDEEFKAAKESIAYGCIKYADLCHDRIKEYVFSFDKMLADKGNTAVYLLYALTRIRSIARTANVSQEEMKKAIETTPISIEHEKEWKLVKVLLKFPDIVTKVVKDLSIHSLCDFCYEIACTFSEFYDNCYCVEKNKTGEIVKVNMGRILLTEVTAMMLEQCFSLLGLKPVEKM
ncbi:hypothetical protein QAD02_012038 [Eretmocerus hayati]|uniref:Uncharacterized protein n=1 Tax=Eretmocerus hayati TaxID=131215 RepID=A0ACC2NYS6_9HYME|nr:hypothetical protein QAD02_012038 [Eretmocerus hayati]